MTEHPNYSSLVAKAEAAVQGIKDPELRRVAFQKILDELIAAARPVTLDRPAQGPIASATQPASPNRSLVVAKHSLLLPIAFGFTPAAFVAAAQIPRLAEVLSAAAEGRATIALLRGDEADILLHFATNWIIWSTAAVIAIKYIRAGYQVVRALTMAGVSILALIVGGLLVLAVSPTGSSPSPPARSTYTPSPLFTPSTALPQAPNRPNVTPFAWIPTWAPQGAIKSYMAPDHLGETVWACGPVYALGKDRCSGIALPPGTCQPDQWATLYLGSGMSSSNPIIRVLKASFPGTYWGRLVGNAVCAYGKVEKLRIYTDDGSAYYEELAIQVTTPSALLDGR